MKKIISLYTIISVLLLFTLAGCSSKAYTSTSENTEDIEHISIVSPGYSLELTVGSDDEVKITCPDSEGVMTITDDTLNISLPDNGIAMTIANSEPIKIVLPLKLLKSLSISSDAGEIIAQDFVAEDTSIYCEAGTITIIGVDGVYSGNTHAGEYTLPDSFNIDGTAMSQSFSGTIGDFEDTINIEAVAGDIIIK